jgi:acyl carrier protein
MTAPTRAEILRDLIAILESSLGVQSAGSVNEQTLFFADLGLASIDAVVLSEAIQAHYARVLPFHDLLADMGRRTPRDLPIGELITFVEKQL